MEPNKVKKELLNVLEDYLEEYRVTLPGQVGTLVLSKDRYAIVANAIPLSLSGHGKLSKENAEELVDNCLKEVAKQLADISDTFHRERITQIYWRGELMLRTRLHDTLKRLHLE